MIVRVIPKCCAFESPGKLFADPRLSFCKPADSVVKSARRYGVRIISYAPNSGFVRRVLSCAERGVGSSRPRTYFTHGNAASRSLEYSRLVVDMFLPLRIARPAQSPAVPPGGARISIGADGLTKSASMGVPVTTIAYSASFFGGQCENGVLLQRPKVLGKSTRRACQLLIGMNQTADGYRFARADRCRCFRPVLLRQPCIAAATPAGAASPSLSHGSTAFTFVAYYTAFKAMNSPEV